MGKANKIWIGKKTQSLRKSFVDYLIFSLAKNGGRKVAEASTEKSLNFNHKKKKKKNNSMHAQVFRFREQIHEVLNTNIALALKWFAQLEGNI